MFPIQPQEDPISTFIADCEARGWLDADGVLIPAQWRARPDKWQKQPLNWRLDSSAHHQEKARLEAQKEAKRAARASSPHATAFTTKSAKDWARSRGWALVDEERSSLYKTKAGKFVRRTHDLMIGADLMLDDPSGQVTGLILVQAAGRYERTVHYDRFVARGGVGACTRRGCSFYYVEFVRGNPDPVLVECWATTAHTSLPLDLAPSPVANPAALE